MTGWKRFTTEFTDGGRIAVLSWRELRAAFMPTTNDACEGIFGSWRQAKFHKPTMGLVTFNSIAMYNCNNTREWELQNDSQELQRFARREGRAVAESGTVWATQEMHSKALKEKAEQNNEVRAQAKERKDTRTSKVESITPHLKADWWNPASGNKYSVDDLNLQFAWLQVPSRGVKVPPNLHKKPRSEKVAELMKILASLTDDARKKLYVSHTQESADEPEVYMEKEGEKPAEDYDSDELD